MTDQQTIVLCKDCKHWAKTQFNTNEYTHACMLSSSSMVDSGITKAVAMAEYGYSSELFTRPDFGCVMGEK